MRILSILVSASTIALAACSNNPLDPGAGSKPGSGTATLLVNGTAHAEPNSPNVSSDTAFTTNIDVDVSLNNNPVTTGTVTIYSRTTPKGTALIYQGGGNGTWSGTIANYDEVYEFEVISGPDKVTGVYVDGPDIQVFTKPAAGTALDASIAQTVTWSRQNPADETRFSVGDRNGLVITDSGTYSMPALSLHYDKGQPVDNTLRLTRSNTVTPRGGAPGSSFTVQVAQELDVVAMACAACP